VRAEDGTLYGVRLGDTQLYKTTAVGAPFRGYHRVYGASIVGRKSSKELECDGAKEYFAALVD